MKEILYDVMVGAIILGVIMVAVLPLFFKNITLINRSAEKEERLRQVGVTSELQVDAIYSGADIIAIVKWYAPSDPSDPKEAEVYLQNPAPSAVKNEVTTSDYQGITVNGTKRYKLIKIDQTSSPKVFTFQEQ